MRRGTAHRGRPSAAGLGALLAVLASCGRSPIPPAFVGQLMTDPPAYLGKPVELEGTVVTVSTEPVTAYVLADSSGQTIEVRTSKLPPQGATVRLYGQVAQNEANVLVPIVVEARRSETDRPPILVFALLGFGAGVLLLVVGLDVLAQLHRRRVAGTPRRSTTDELPGAELAVRVEPRPYRDGDSFVFRVLAGVDAGRTFHVAKRRIHLGRGDSRHNEVALTDPTVSRRQAVLCYSRKRSGMFLLNEADTNPTSVNGRATARSPVLHGDVIKMGHVLLQVMFEEDAAPPAPAPTPTPTPEPTPAAPVPSAPTLADEEDDDATGP